MRVALGVPWIEDLRGAYAHAVLCGAARQVLPGYASESREPGMQERLEDFTRRLAKAIAEAEEGLQELAPAALRHAPPSLADVDALERGIARTELRAAAFLATGDLLATLDSARANDVELGWHDGQRGACAGCACCIR